MKRAIAALAGAVSILSPAALAAGERVPIAVAGFDYSDSSGEARDRQGEHQARLEAFVHALRRDLAKSSRYRVVELECPPASCSAGRMTPAELLDVARRAGAWLLLYGGIHKMSSLVQFGKAEAVDLAADKVVFDRLISFRGDSEDAWRHAESFLARELIAADLSR